jgi:ureidoglycolate amidohydrolase
MLFQFCTLLLTLACAILPITNAAFPDVSKLDISGKIIVEQLTHLAKFSDDPNPAVTRILFTANDIRGRTYVKQLMHNAGLIVTEDSLGSIFGTLPAADGDTAGEAVATGSHCDAIPLAGMYDGTVGVIGGIAAIHSLQKAGFKPKKPLQVIFFTSEEPTRFGLSCIGSRGMAGALSSEKLAELRDMNGTTFLEAAASAGSGAASEAEALESARRTTSDLSYFLELHIEQGPELEEKKIPIGVVTAVAAPAAIRVSFHGEGGHAGGQLMFRRNDAALAAAELALAVEKAALSTGAIDTVATAGKWSIGPNAINSVPREATLEIDIRDVNQKRRDTVVKKIRDSAAEIAKKRKVKADISTVFSDPPATSDPAVVKAVSDTAAELNLKTLSMPSRAYHDTLFMAQIAPSGMVFIPCKNGWSHRPDEFSTEQDIENGVRVLAGAMAKLAGDGSIIEESEKNESGTENTAVNDEL